jgi:hypothetical protein
MHKALTVCVCVVAFAPGFLRAQQGQPGGKDFAEGSGQARYSELEARVRALEAEVEALKTALAAARPSESGPAPQAAAPPPELGGAGGMAKALNPDISMIGNFIGGAGHNGVSPSPSLSLRESELGVQAVVDPYARADFFISVGSEGASIEEGYLTFPALPGGFLAKVGRMRTSFGKLNAQHSHVLPWIDRPLIVGNLMGGDPGESDAGIKDEGLYISRILPAPRGIFLEGSAEIDQGNSGSLFQASRRSDVSSFYRLRGYSDLNDSTNLEIGGSYARGHNDLNDMFVCSPSLSGSSSVSSPCQHGRDFFGKDFITQLADLDATLRWKPLRRAIYHSFIGRTEFVWSRRDDFPGTVPQTQRAFGYYASADYQLGRRWFTGVRFDWAERARAASLHDSGESLVLTYWPSEFSQIRGQLRRTTYAEGTTANELLLQFQFSIGAHGAHPF